MNISELENKDKIYISDELREFSVCLEECLFGIFGNVYVFFSQIAPYENPFAGIEYCDCIYRYNFINGDEVIERFFPTETKHLKSYKASLGLIWKNEEDFISLRIYNSLHKYKLYANNCKRKIYTCFIDKNSIHNVEFDSYAETIHERAFSDAKNLVYAQTGKAKILPYAFQNCRSLSIFRGEPRIIGEYAFENCVNLESVEFGDRFFSGFRRHPYVGEYAFNGCPLTECKRGDFYIANGVLLRYIGNKRIVVVPDDVEYIADGVFRGMDMETVILPVSLRCLGNNAFYGCTELRMVVVPSFAAVGNGVFSNCTNLIDVVFHSNDRNDDPPFFNKHENYHTVHFDCSIADVFSNTPFINKYPGFLIASWNGYNVLVRCLIRNADTITVPDCVDTFSDGAFTGVNCRVLIANSVRYMGGHPFNKSQISELITNSYRMKFNFADEYGLKYRIDNVNCEIVYE